MVIGEGNPFSYNRQDINDRIALASPSALCIYRTWQLASLCLITNSITY